MGLDWRYLGYCAGMDGICGSLVVQRAKSEDCEEDAVNEVCRERDLISNVYSKYTPSAMCGMYIMEFIGLE
jgi:hypothetical protein